MRVAVVSTEDEAVGALRAIADRVRRCTLCRLHATRLHAVPGEGPGAVDVLIVGEAPGRDEDASGRPFVGRAGRILDAALGAAGLPRESVFITNLVKCRPPGNRRPKRDEWEACRPYLVGQIASLRPKAVITLGDTALRGLLGPGHGLRLDRGRSLGYAGVPVIATYHPAAILYNRKLEAALRRDLRKVSRILKEPPRPGETRSTNGRTPSRGRAARR